MSRYDEEMAAIIGRAVLQPEFRRKVMEDPAGALSGHRLPPEYHEVLVAGLRDLEQAGVATETLAKKFGTNAWGVGGSIA